MTELEEAKKRLKEAQDAVRQAEAKARVQSRLSELSKRPTELPPGFRFGWRHRHDPFPSFWELTFTNTSGKESQAWQIEGDDNEVHVKAREIAWAQFDFAVEICRAAGLLKGD